MALHFDREEFAQRQNRARKTMAARGLDGLLLFRQESLYYLTGFDTSGYVTFQCLYLGADGTLCLLTRSPDLRQARLTSVIEDIRIWVDREGANPADDLRDMLASHGCRGRRLGVEFHAFGLTAQRGRLLEAALDGFCVLVDASDLVRDLRLVKSPAELAYVRKAGELANDAMKVALRMTVPGASVGAIYGEMQNVIMRGDGDPSATRWVMGSGEDALMVRYHTGHGQVADNDQVVFEPAAAYRHYHVPWMHVALTGAVDPRHRHMFAACVDALDACQRALRPGNTVGHVFDVHARVFTEAGYEGHFLKACGYTMGAVFPPSWMDMPMLYHGNPQVLEPGMVFFVHMILLNSDTGLAMSLGETAIITDDGCEPVCRVPRELVVN